MFPLGFQAATPPQTVMVQQGDGESVPCIYEVTPSPDATEGGYSFPCYGNEQFPTGPTADPSFASVAAAMAAWSQFDAEDWGSVWRLTSKDFYPRSTEAGEALVSDPSNPLRKPV